MGAEELMGMEFAEVAFAVHQSLWIQSVNFSKVSGTKKWSTSEAHYLREMSSRCDPPTEPEVEGLNG